MKLSPRAEKIRQHVTMKSQRQIYNPDENQFYTKYPPEVKVCTERLHLITQSYKNNEADPAIIKNAKAFKHLLENMTIYIDPYQLIAGNETSHTSKLPLYVEMSHDWIKANLNTVYKDIFSEADMKRVYEDFAYWDGKTMGDRWKNLLPEDLDVWSEITKSGVFSSFVRKGMDRPNPDWDKLLKIGMNGLLEESRGKLAELNARIPDNMSAGEYIRKKTFFEANIMSIEASIAWMRRYATLASELARQAKDKKRKQELLKMSEVCDRVSRAAPETFYEAVQFIYFIHLLQRLECMSHGAGYRLDQILYPYYQKDLHEGNITDEEVLELFECLWLKIEDVGEIAPPEISGSQSGALAWQNATLGGIKADGSDATNELSYLMIQATLNTGAKDPSLCLRYHDNIPEDLINKALELIAEGHGMPAMFNDNAIMPFLEKWYAIPSDESWNYTPTGCVKVGMPGKNWHAHWPNVGGANLLKLLEFALNQGKSMGGIGGDMQIGYPTPDPLTFESIEDVKRAYIKQVEYAAEKIATLTNLSDAIYAQNLKRPFSSGLVDGGIEKGQDCSENFYQEGLALLVGGMTNIANSMAVIEKLVFDDQVVSMEELLTALKQNWEGYEDLRQQALRVPKYGNDDDYVDKFMKWVHVESNKAFMKQKGNHGGMFTLGSSIASGYYAVTMIAWASPDGRKFLDPGADATASPTAGSDTRGPTAVLNSVRKIDVLDSGWDQLLNAKFHPAMLTGNADAAKAYLKTWSQGNNWHVQFNVVDKETLLDAQEHPQNHQDLIVRVAGYSAFFVDLGRGVQDDIIKRTELSA